MAIMYENDKEITVMIDDMDFKKGEATLTIDGKPHTRKIYVDAMRGMYIDNYHGKRVHIVEADLERLGLIDEELEESPWGTYETLASRLPEKN